MDECKVHEGFSRESQYLLPLAFVVEDRAGTMLGQVLGYSSLGSLLQKKFWVCATKYRVVGKGGLKNSRKAKEW